ncbi:MoaD/ThiS family protein [Chloroflexota bacterium]
MSIKIKTSPYLQPYTNDIEVIEVHGNTVSTCLNSLVELFPNVEKLLFAANGKLHTYIDVYINKESAYPGVLAKPVKDGDELHILFIISGG